MASPLAGRTLRGQVLCTWVRGRKVFDRTADWMADPGAANVLTPA